jgi:hypothetical protein
MDLNGPAPTCRSLVSAGQCGLRSIVHTEGVPEPTPTALNCAKPQATGPNDVTADLRLSHERLGFAAVCTTALAMCTKAPHFRSSAARERFTQLRQPIRTWESGTLPRHVTTVENLRLPYTATDMT